MIADAIASMLDWRPRDATIENPSFSLNDPVTWKEMFGGVESASGAKVNHATALSLGAVWQCVSTISGDVAVSTMNIFRTMDDDDRQIDWDHDCQSLVSVQPNNEMSAFEFWRRLMVHACLWQNGYAFIMREGRSAKGKTLAILNLLPDRTCPMRHEDGTLYYASEVGGRMEPFRADEIIHVKGLSVDGSKGCDLVEKARDSWGLALAAQGFASKFFKHGAQSGGFLAIPATFTEKAKQTLEEGFDKKYAGADNAFKTVILRDGATFHQNQIDAQKSQMHELRDDQVRDTARFFNMPPSKVGLSDSVSYNSQEQSQIAYLTGCLNHWFGAIRGECAIKLLRPNERASGKWYCEHNVTKLLEVDTKTMNEVLAIQRQNEIINADEYRRKIGLNKRPDGKGGEYVNPNTKSAPNQNTATEEPPKKEPPTKAIGIPEEPLRKLFCSTIERVARRICLDARNNAKKSARFAEWINGKSNEQREFFREQILLVMNVIESETANAVTISLDGQFFSMLMELLSPLNTSPFKLEELQQNVEARCDVFEKTIADKLSELVFPKDKSCAQAV